MYLDVGNEDRSLQGLVPVTPPVVRVSPPALAVNSPSPSGGLDAQGKPGEMLDPLGSQVLDVVKHLLSEGEMDRVTIQDVMDEVSAGDSAVRQRLNHLVDLGHIECWTGSGRRPSYYFLPKTNASEVADRNATPSEDESMLTQLLEMNRAAVSEIQQIEKEMESRQAQLDALHKDVEAYARIIDKISNQPAKKPQEGE
jgi:predicted ArsR family transcriptional regulator